MPGGEACLLDSNILLRISKSDDPQHAAISYALHALVGHGVRLCYTSQTLAEFWNASTRPLDKNGLGLSVAETDRLARVIERDFEFLPDSREVHDRWRSLLVAHNIQGVQVHDARLAARSVSENSSLLLLNSLEKECKCVRIIWNHGETIPNLPSRTRYAFTSEPARMVAG